MQILKRTIVIGVFFSLSKTNLLILQVLSDKQKNPGVYYFVIYIYLNILEHSTELIKIKVNNYLIILRSIN